MKILPFQIPKPEHDALIYQEDKEFIFFDKFHQHEEIQVSFIAEGEGTLIVGDTINYYKKGDVIALGSNLPHVFKSDTSTNKTSVMLTLFFSKAAFGNHFFDLEELLEIKSFFKKAENGFKVSAKTEGIDALFFALDNSSKLERFINCLKILQLVSKSKYKLLSSFIYEKKYSDLEGKRMRAIMDYTIQNYEQSIQLNDIAKVAAMTKNAFCKYFKKRTNKTYVHFLNELRIEHACKLIFSDQDLSIAEIADQSGFNNISNFNRQFKTVKGVSPSVYRTTKTY